jgi:protein NRD1
MCCIFSDIQSTTPEGSPSPDFNLLGQQQQQSNQSQAAPADTSAILAALANMAKQTTTALPASGLPAQASMNNMLGAQNGLPQSTPSSVDQGPSAANGQAVNPLGALFAGMSNGVQSQNQNQAQNVAAQNPLASLLPRAQVPAIPQAAPLGQDPQQQFQLIQLMAAQGIPPDQWGTALQLLALQGANGQSNVGGVPNFAPPQPGANGWGGQSRDQQGPDYMRSPPSQYRRRSRSPGWDRRRDPSPPRRRDSPVYGDYRGDAAGRNRDDRGGRRGNDYRQRSPPDRRRRSPTPPPKDVPLPPPGVKNVLFDPSIGKGNIKVLSRTLFVGGVTSSEAHLRSLFANFGIVQTCIVNVDKRHAFVKMIDRKDAVAARDGMEQYKSGDMQLRVGISQLCHQSNC